MSRHEESPQPDTSGRADPTAEELDRTGSARRGFLRKSFLGVGGAVAAGTAGQAFAAETCDVADVKLQFEETPNDSYVEGRRNVTIFVQKLNTEDLEQISEFI